MRYRMFPKRPKLRNTTSFDIESAVLSGQKMEKSFPNLRRTRRDVAPNVFVKVILMLGFLASIVFHAPDSYATSYKCLTNSVLCSNAIATAIAKGQASAIINDDGVPVYVVTYGPTDSDGNATGEPPQASIYYAFEAWNAQQDTTGVVFQLATEGTKPTLGVYDTTDMEDAPDEDPATDCLYTFSVATDHTPPPGIYYNSAFDDREEMGSDAQAQNVQAAEHEIGHLLGLDDRKPGYSYSGGGGESVMDSADDFDGDCGDNLSTLATTGIQPNDAAGGAGCESQAKTQYTKCHKNKS